MSDVVFSPRLHFFLLFMLLDIFRTLRPPKSFFLKPAKVKALLLEKERERDADVRKQKKAARS